MLNRVLASSLLACSLLASCSIGAPPGFSSGDRWEFPLVGPLENGQLVTAAFIDGKGPYLMAIDPDSNTSIIDAAIASELELHAGIGPRLLDETDTHRQTQLAEVPRIKIGNLTVESRVFLLTKVGAFAFGGRQIRGVLGRDVIADSLAFGFDRQRGVAWLTTQKGFVAPVDSDVWSYSLVSNHLDGELSPPGRKIVTAHVGDKKLGLHLDLGATRSQLRSGLWASAGLQSTPMQSTLIDEIGTTRQFTTATVANQVTIGHTTQDAVLFAPYDDRRWEEEDVDGTIGLDFFKGKSVWANWDKNKVYVAADKVVPTEERIARWGSTMFAACPHTGCATVTLTDPNSASRAPAGNAADRALLGDQVAEVRMAPMPPTPRNPILTVDRDPAAAGKDLEITLQITPPPGSTETFPHVVVNLPAGQDHAAQPMDPRFLGAIATVVDVSPFPRACSNGGSCVYILPE